MTRTLALTGALLLAVATLSAQQADSSRSIATWRDSVGVWPAESLRGALDRAGAPKAPLDRLRTGWLLLSLAVHTDTSTAADLAARAMDQFYEVTVRRPRWVEGWYGLGMAKLALLSAGAREIRSPHQTAGAGWAQGAANAFLQAQRVDPPFIPAALALAKLTPQLRDHTSEVEIQRRLDQAVTANARDPALWILVADAATRRNDDSGAIVALTKAQALLDRPSGGILLALARAEFALGRPELAAEEYYRGAAIPDSDAAASYRYDIGLVADSDELARYDATPADHRVEWVHEFWAKRERASGRPEGSRLVEHERRLRYARVHFAAISRTYRQFGFNEPYHDGPVEFDDRGAVYLRHGAPDQTAIYIDPGVRTNESWLYYRPAGNLVLHFVDGIGGPWGLGGWHLIDSPFGIPGAGRHLSGLLESRMILDPRFGTLSLQFESDSMLVASYIKMGNLGIGPTGTAIGWLGGRDEAHAATIEKMAREGRAAIRRGLTTDSDPLRFERNLEPVVQVFGAGDTAPGGGRLVVAMSIPFDPHIPALPLPGGAVGYTLRVRVTSGDDSGRTTLDVDSLVRLRTPRPLVAGEHLTFVRSYSLPANGDQRVRVILADSALGIGDVRVVNGVPLPDLGRPALALSDLIVGSDRSGISWMAPGGESVPLNPLNAWGRNDHLALSFECGGLQAGAPVHVRIAIGDVTADTTRPPKSSIEFDATASGGRTFFSQLVGLDALRPGRYLLTVTIGSGGQSAQRERRITIVAR